MMFAGTIVTSDEEIEALRRIRNAGREWMTGDTNIVTKEAQYAWWDKMRANADFLPVIYRDDKTIVGYGILTRRYARLFVSLAVDPAVSGQGYGTKIYCDLAARVSEDIYARIYARNAASLRAARRAGFIEHSVDEDLITLVKAAR